MNPKRDKGINSGDSQDNEVEIENLMEIGDKI